MDNFLRHTLELEVREHHRLIDLAKKDLENLTKRTKLVENEFAKCQRELDLFQVIT